MRNMPLPISTSAVLRNDVCCERVRATSHLCRPTGDTVLDDLLGTEQPSKSQSRRKRFRETANAHYLLAIRQCIEAGRHCPLKREVAIDIILHDQEVVLARQPDNFETPCFGQCPSSRVVKVRDGVEHAGNFASRMESHYLLF